MDIESEILKEHSKRQTVRIAKWIGHDANRFKELMELFLHGEKIVTQRAAWILSHCADRHPELISPWLGAMVEKVKERGVHDAVKRNVVRILERTEIPRKILGTVVTICFDLLSSPDSPIAVRAYSMTVLLNAAMREPDLKTELKEVITQMQPYAGAGLRARSRQVLKKLSEN